MDVRDFKIGTGKMATAVSSEKSEEKLASKQKVVTEETNAASTDKEENDEALVFGYREFLKDNGITDVEVNEVLDAILTDSKVTWTFQILGKIEASFVMRPTWANEVVIRILEVEQPSTYSRFTNVLNIYNMAGSLHTYGDRKFTPQNEDELKEVLLFLNNLAYPIFIKLVDQLVLFDRLIAVATSNWAIKNFTTPPSEESEQTP